MALSGGEFADNAVLRVPLERTNERNRPGRLRHQTRANKNLFAPTRMLFYFWSSLEPVSRRRCCSIVVCFAKHRRWWYSYSFGSVIFPSEIRSLAKRNNESRTSSTPNCPTAAVTCQDILAVSACLPWPQEESVGAWT